MSCPVHHIDPAAVVAAYAPPPRCPDELLASDLPDWAVRVWLTIRGFQGRNDAAWHPYEVYGEACGKSYAMVRKAVAALVEAGWLERLERLPGGRGYRLRCLWNRAVSAPTQREQGSRWTPTQREPHSRASGNVVPTQREQGSTPPHTPPNKDQSVKESKGEEDDGDARARDAGPRLGLGDLPPNAARYRAQVEDYLGRDAAGRRGLAFAAWKAGNTPAAEVARVLAEAEARAGPAAVAAAVAITAAEADSHFPRKRIRFFLTTLANIEDHARRQRLAPAAPSGARGRDDAKNDPAGSYERIRAGVESAFRDG